MRNYFPFYSCNIFSFILSICIALVQFLTIGRRTLLFGERHLPKNVSFQHGHSSSSDNKTGLKWFISLYLCCFATSVDSRPAMIIAGPNVNTTQSLGIHVSYEPRWINRTDYSHFGSTFNISFSSPETFRNGLFYLRFHFSSAGTTILDAWGSWVVQKLPDSGWYQIQPIAGQLPLTENNTVFFSFNGVAATNLTDLGLRFGIDEVDFQPLASSLTGPSVVFRLDNGTEFANINSTSTAEPEPFAQFLKDNRATTVIPINLTPPTVIPLKYGLPGQFFGGIFICALLGIYILIIVESTIWNIILKMRYHYKLRRYQSELRLERADSIKSTSTLVVEDSLEALSDVAIFEIYDPQRHTQLMPRHGSQQLSFQRDSLASQSSLYAASSLAPSTVYNDTPLQPFPSLPSAAHHLQSPRSMRIEVMPQHGSITPLGFARGQTPPSVQNPMRAPLTRRPSLSLYSPISPAQPSIILESGAENEAPVVGNLAWMQQVSDEDDSISYTPRNSFDAVIEEEEEEEDDALWGVQDDEEEDEPLPSPPARMLLQHRGSVVAAHAPLLSALRVKTEQPEDDSYSSMSDDGREDDEDYVYGDYGETMHDSNESEYIYGAQEYLGEDRSGDDQLPPSPLDPFPPLISPRSSVPPGPYSPVRHQRHESMTSLTSVRSALKRRTSASESDPTGSLPPTPTINKRVSFDEGVERLEQEREEKIYRREERRRRRELRRQEQDARRLEER